MDEPKGLTPEQVQRREDRRHFEWRAISILEALWGLLHQMQDQGITSRTLAEVIKAFDEEQIVADIWEGE